MSAGTSVFSCSVGCHKKYLYNTFHFHCLNQFRLLSIESVVHGSYPMM